MIKYCQQNLLKKPFMKSYFMKRIKYLSNFPWLNYTKNLKVFRNIILKYCQSWFVHFNQHRIRFLQGNSLAVTIKKPVFASLFDSESWKILREHSYEFTCECRSSCSLSLDMIKEESVVLSPARSLWATTLRQCSWQNFVSEAFTQM